MVANLLTENNHKELIVNNATTMPPTFVALVLHLYGGKGHVYSYQKSVTEAVKLNGWDHLAVISPDPILKEFPSDWRIEFADSGALDYEGGKILNMVRRLQLWLFISSTYKYFVSLLRALKKELNRSPNKKIIFLDTYNPLQLLSLMFALMFVKRKQIVLWLLYRGGPNWGGAKHRMLARSFSYSFRLFNPFFELLLGKQNVVLLTDSDMLRQSLPLFYKRQVHLIPIPHTAAYVDKKLIAERSRDEIVCWWPGAPRPDKGLDIIQRLATEVNSEAPPIKLLVAQSAPINYVSGGIKIQKIADKLPRSEYDRNFYSCDLILLPYDSDIYNESTSGIFTECIVAGAIPLVTKGTWMAYELSKFNLDELVIDWDMNGIFGNLIRVARDPCVRGKIDKMKKAYEEYHCVKSCAETFKVLLRA